MAPRAPDIPESRTRLLCGLVLAGGRSRRMGCDKAALVHPDGRPLARRCCDLLREAGCGLLVLSLREDQAMPGGFSDSESPVVVRDAAGVSAGPISGMVAGMRLRPDADWLVLACDLPRLDLATLLHLSESRQFGERFLAYRSMSDGLPEPLCAVYSDGALELLESALADDFRCPRKLLIQSECRLLAPVSERALENANTPEDWEQATSP